MRTVLAALLLAGSLLSGVTPSASATETTNPEPEPANTETDYGRMVLVLDSSGSMKEPAGDGSTKIDAAKDALGQVVDQLPEEANVGLRVFGATVFSREDKGACTDSQLVVEPATDNRDALRTAIEDYRPYGETPIAYALGQAADDLGAEGTRSIVLVSDGIATCEPDPCEVAADLAERGIDLQIDVVGLSVDPAARSQLRCIAARGGGTYYDADSAEDIVKSLGEASTRALRPFGIDGDPIEGGPTQEAATPIEAGRYADRHGRQAADRWYRYERTIPGSTVIVSAYQLAPGLLSDLYLSVTAEDGTQCNGGPDPVMHPIATGYARVAAAEGGCEGPLLINVRRMTDGAAVPFGLGVVEEPAVTDADSLPGAVDSARFTLPRATKPVTPIQPGSDFDNAAELASGQTYSATIVPGEVQAFKVHVGWGQQLAVRVDHSALNAAQQAALGDSVGSVSLQLMNPVRATIFDDGLTGNEDGRTRFFDTSGFRVTEGTFPVEWANRDGESTAYLPGDYLVLYTADFTSKKPVELPYRITAGVTGDETAGPTYADGQSLVIEPSAEPSESASDSSTSDEPSSPSAEDGEDTGLNAAALIIGGVLLVGLALAIGIAVTRRRR